MPPLGTVRGLLSVKPAKVGLEVVAIPWMVLITPLLAVKLVLLKVAMPLVEPSAAALLMVIVPATPVELAKVSRQYVSHAHIVLQHAVQEPFQGYWQTSDYGYWDYLDAKPVRRALGEMKPKSEIARPTDQLFMKRLNRTSYTRSLALHGRARPR